jgi:hypothetical protein
MTSLLSESWTPLPGPFELLEREDTDSDALADSSSVARGTRGIGSSLGRERLRRLLDRLRGLRRVEILLDSAPTWFDLVELHVPPEGHAELKRSRSTKGDVVPQLKLFGLGFGSGVTASFAESTTFDANKNGKIMQVKMLVTASRYVDGEGGSILRVDIGGPPTGVEHRIIDLPTAILDEFDRSNWTLLERADLSGVADEGKFAWIYTAGRRAKWTVGLNLMVPSLPVGASLQAEVEGSEEFETSFEVPYGRDVIFYHRTGEAPLAPHCSTTPAGF